MKRHVLSWAALSLCALTFSSPAYPGTVCVRSNGLDANSGASWELAKSTIQAGINASAQGDEIWAAAGTYQQRITLKSGIALYGGFAGNETSREGRDYRANQTVIDGAESGGTVVSIPSTATIQCVFDGFAITGVGEASGIASYFGGAPHIIRNNTLRPNADRGTGISCNADTVSGNTVTGYREGIHVWRSAAVTGNTLVENGTGIYCDSANWSTPGITGNTITRGRTGISCNYFATPTILNNLVAENSIGINLQSATGTVACNVVHGNVPGKGMIGGGVVLSNTEVLLVNNTIVGNASTLNGGLTVDSIDRTPVIANNIIAFNSPGVHKSGSGPSPQMSNNCVYGNAGYDYSGMPDPTGSSGNIKSDPKLADLHRKNTHIQSDSPCIGAGANSFLQAGWTDADGQPRLLPTGGTVDIGADESDGTSWTPGPPKLIVRVRPDGNDANDGSTWALAKKTVQAAVDWAVVGDEIWVAAGTYSERISVFDGIALYGGFLGDESSKDERNYGANAAILDGNRQGVVVRFTLPDNTTARLDGFTVRNGSAGGVFSNGGIAAIANNVICDNTLQGNGGGISIPYGGPPSITGNTIIRNSCSYNGGGIYIYRCSPTISGNTISANAARIGGGICSDNPPEASSATITQNRITGNTASFDAAGLRFAVNSLTCTGNVFTGNSMSSGTGCAVSVSGFLQGSFSNNVVARNTGTSKAVSAGYALLVTNNTVVDNAGTGIDIGSNAQCRVDNNILAFNAAGLRWNGVAGSSYGYNCIYGNTNDSASGPPPGDQGVNQDPLFVDRANGDYHLNPSSPCVNAGINTANPQLTTDFDGEPRLMCGATDLGVDEVPNLPPPLTTVQAAKAAARNNTWVRFQSLPVSAVVPGAFYVEPGGRYCGIRVEGPYGSVATGMTADIEGVIRLNRNGEAHIYPISVATEAGGPVVAPCFLRTDAIGGGQSGIQPGVWGWTKVPDETDPQWLPAAGINSIGLLATVCGKVTQIDLAGSYFYLDDGSSLNDGTYTYSMDYGSPPVANVGVRIALTGRSYTTGQFLSVRGVSSCFRGNSGDILRVVRPSGPGDVSSLNGP